MAQAKKENGLDNTQPKAPSPLGGGSGGNGTADISGPGEDEVTKSADGEPKALAAYLYRALCHIVECSRESDQVRFLSPGQGNVHEGAGLGSDSRLRHGLPLMWDKSDVANGTAPMPENGSAGQNESPEAVSERNDGR